MTEENNQKIFIFQLRFPPPDLTKSSNKFYRTNQPREKALANIIHCTCFCQHVVNQNRSHARTNMGKNHCTSCCWYFVWLCGVGGVGGEVGEETIQTYLYSNCAFLTKSSNKFYRTNQPRERLGQHHLLYVFLSACWKTGQDPCKNKHGENFIAQVWLVFCVVVWCCVLLVVLGVK